MSDHVITNSLNGKFKCEFCGTEEAPPFMPAPINVIIDAMDYFIDQHKDCKQPQAEAVMSEYIKGFDAGYDYVLTEVERFTKEAIDPHASPDALTRRIKSSVLVALCNKLKMEGKPDIRENT
jgi:hypothetical protein